MSPHGTQSTANPITSKSGGTPVIHLTGGIQFHGTPVRQTGSSTLPLAATERLLHVSLPLTSAASLMGLCTCM